MKWSGLVSLLSSENCNTVSKDWSEAGGYKNSIDVLRDKQPAKQLHYIVEFFAKVSVSKIR